jgi:hypothetical protein
VNDSADALERPRPPRSHTHSSDAWLKANATASQGVLPTFVSHGGSVILGIDGNNSNYSRGTFYEGAVVAAFPADDTELSVLRNIQAVGYGR